MSVPEDVLPETEAEVQSPEQADDDPGRGDGEWVIAHWADLCDAFPMQWIAVLSQEVIGHGWSQKEALGKAKEALEFLGPGTGGARPNLFFCERSAERFLEHGAG